MTTITFSSVDDPGLLDGRFRIVSEIARGGMGIVYEGVDETTGEGVAIKVLRDGVDATAIARFEQEADAAAKIHSPNVVRILASGTTADRRSYLVMELLHGEDLGAYGTRMGPLPLDEVASYVAQACDALARAHALGIIHRDLKPSNLFRHVAADGNVVIKVVDFGISKSLEREITLTQQSEGAILGSPMYMSPEQIKDPRCVDHRSDLWSLGVVCYRLLTGETPWGGKRIDEVLARILGATGLPSLEARGLPVGIDDVLARCVAPRPDDRWPDANAFARALSLYSCDTSTLVLASSGEALPTVAVQTIRHEPPPRRFHGWFLTAAVAILLAFASWVLAPRAAKTAAPAPAPAAIAPPIVPSFEAPPPQPAPAIASSSARSPTIAPRRTVAPARRAATPRRELQPNPYAKGEAP